MRTTPSRALPLLLAAALAVPGCLSFSPDDYFGAASDLPTPENAAWVRSESFRCDDFDVLWETCKIQIVKGGYSIDDDATTYKNRQIVTRWKVELGLSRSSGKRRRRFVRFEEVKEMKAGWKVGVATVQQQNVDIEDPLNPAAAKWRKDEPDTEDAETVAYMVMAQFRELGPSKEFENR